MPRRMVSIAPMSSPVSTGAVQVPTSALTLSLDGLPWACS